MFSFCFNITSRNRIPCFHSVSCHLHRVCKLQTLTLVACICWKMSAARTCVSTRNLSSSVTKLYGWRHSVTKLCGAVLSPSSVKLHCHQAPLSYNVTKLYGAVLSPNFVELYCHQALWNCTDMDMDQALWSYNATKLYGAIMSLSSMDLHCHQALWICTITKLHVPALSPSSIEL